MMDLLVDQNTRILSPFMTGLSRIAGPAHGHFVLEPREFWIEIEIEIVIEIDF
jgi:hypothetical protein